MPFATNPHPHDALVFLYRRQSSIALCRDKCRLCPQIHEKNISITATLDIYNENIVVFNFPEILA